MQPVLRNTKGAASRILGVIGRTLLAPCNHELLQAQVARRYDPGSLPRDNRQHMRQVRGRSQAGISLTGREARTVMGRLAGGMVLPLPFHSLVLAFRHMVHLCSGSNNMATVTWQAMGMLYTYIVHIREFAEEGCTATLYMHGSLHTWFNPRTPMLYSDEAGERDLQVAKSYAPVTSTRQDASVGESLKHELYQKIVQEKKEDPVCKNLGAGATKRCSGGVHGCCQCHVACGLPTSLRAFAAFLGGRWLLPIYAPRHTFSEMHLSRCKSQE